MKSLTYSRDRCVLASRDFPEARKLGYASKITVELHAPDCYQIKSWKGWHFLYWPGNALAIGTGLKHDFTTEDRLTLLKFVAAVCKISQRERIDDFSSFKEVKVYDGEDDARAVARSEEVNAGLLQRTRPPRGQVARKPNRRRRDCPRHCGHPLYHGCKAR